MGSPTASVAGETLLLWKGSVKPLICGFVYPWFTDLAIQMFVHQGGKRENQTKKWKHNKLVLELWVEFTKQIVSSPPWFSKRFLFALCCSLVFGASSSLLQEWGGNAHITPAGQAEGKEQ